MDNSARYSRSPLIAAGVAVLLHGFLGLLTLIGMLCVVPGYTRHFRDYQMELPGATVAVWNIANWFTAYWYVVFFAAVPLLALDGLIVYMCWSRKGTRVLGVL